MDMQEETVFNNRLFIFVLIEITVFKNMCILIGT